MEVDDETALVLGWLHRRGHAAACARLAADVGVAADAPLPAAHDATLETIVRAHVARRTARHQAAATFRLERTRRLHARLCRLLDELDAVGELLRDPDADPAAAVDADDNGGGTRATRAALSARDRGVLSAVLLHAPSPKRARLAAAELPVGGTVAELLSATNLFGTTAPPSDAVVAAAAAAAAQPAPSLPPPPPPLPPPPLPGDATGASETGGDAAGLFGALAADDGLLEQLVTLPMNEFARALAAEINSRLRPPG